MQYSMTALMIKLTILPKLPTMIDTMLSIIEIMESTIVEAQAHLLCVKRPHDKTKLATPSAIVTAVITIIPKSSSSVLLSMTNWDNASREYSKKTPPTTRIMPLIIMRIATTVILVGRFLSNLILSN